MNVFIRPAETADLPRLREIFACARAFMSAHGNPSQWGSRYPEDSTITRQMHAGCLYAVESSTGVHGVFACVPGEEPTYAHIEGGSWLDPSPYVTIHSLAGDGQIPHLFSYVLDFCLKQCPHVRLDTHRNNHIVQRLAMENDFSYRGVIFVRGNSPRLAFERLPESHALPPEPTALLRAMGITAQRITRFHSVEDDAPYDVWKTDTPAGIRVLKKAKAYEGELYARFLQQTTPWTPRLYDTLSLGRDTYLLLEYIPGRDLCRCTREALTSAVTALAELQKSWWERRDMETAGFPYAQALQERTNRGKIVAGLRDPALDAAYKEYLSLFHTLPRTLCHDDLLPFNLLVQGERCTFIDWEYGGMLPYPTPLARLLAHGTEAPDGLFYLKDEDRAFALELYYRLLPEPMGIPRGAYYRHMNCFFFYEYCEWVALGLQHDPEQIPLFAPYLEKARSLARQLTDHA